MKKKLLWAGFAAASLAAVAALFIFPDVFGGLEIRATVDRTKALALAEERAQTLVLGPPDAQTALVYTNDDQAQAYVELKGGGLAVLNREARAGTYTPAYWTVRRFREGEIREVSLYLSPSGAFLGWNEKQPETAVFPNLSEDEARALAQTAGKASGTIDLAAWSLAETSSVTLPNGRTDWTFVWSLPHSPFGEAEVRWTAVVAGNQVTRLDQSLKVPESFQRWYENERSVNGLITTGSFVGMAILFVLAVVITLRLNRTKEVAWKRSWIIGAVLGLGAAVGSFNGLAQFWMGYDTALPAGVFWATQLVTLGLIAVVLAGLFGLSVAGADALYRRAFPGAFALGTPGALTKMDRSAVGGQITASLLAVPLWLLAVTAFYAFTKANWGWWTPASGLADPNIVGQFIPWLTPLGNALQAAVWEELFFRALPLALAAWAGKKWGRPALWMGVTLVLQAVVFAAGHAGYPGLPGWSRLVELLVPALAFGLIVLRWGLLPAILIHFGYDFVLMSQPLFVTDSAALIPDRIAVVLVALALPGFALWNRYGRRDTAEAPMAPVAHEPVPETKAEPQMAAPEAAASEPASPVVAAPTLSWPWLTALAVGGVVALVVTAQPPIDTLKIDRPAALALAQKALADQGFVPGSQWTLDVTTAGETGDDDRYVRSVGGDAAVVAARQGDFIKPPRWVFQWSDYTGDIQNRERWVVTVARATGALRVYREVPEGKPGAQLTRDEALAVAQAALPIRLGVSADSLTLVSAVEAQRPQRSDWTLEWKDQKAAAPWEGRYQVVVSGDEVTEASKYVYLPEEWTRSWQQNTSVAGLINLVSGLLIFALVGWAVVRGFRAWGQKRFHGPLALVTGAGIFSGTSLYFFNDWGSQAQAFSLAQPWLSQTLTMAVLVPLVFLVMGLAWALAVGGLVTPGTRWQLPSTSRWVPGLAWGLAISGTLAVLEALTPLGTSRLSEVEQAGTFLPWAGQAAANASSPLIYLISLLAWDLAGDWWGRNRRWQAVLLVLIVGLAVHFGLSTDTWQNALVRMGLGGVLTLGLWFALRNDRFALWVVVGTMGMIGCVVSLFQPTFPGAWMGNGLAVVLTGATMVGVGGWLDCSAKP